MTGRTELYPLLVTPRPVPGASHVEEDEYTFACRIGFHSVPSLLQGDAAEDTCVPFQGTWFKCQQLCLLQRPTHAYSGMVLRLSA